MEVILLTRVQSHLGQTHNLEPQPFALRGRPRERRKRGPQRGAAPGHRPNTDCRTGQTGHGPVQTEDDDDGVYDFFFPFFKCVKWPSLFYSYLVVLVSKVNSQHSHSSQNKLHRGQQVVEHRRLE